MTENEGGRASYWILRCAHLDLMLSPAESMTLTAMFQLTECFGFRAATGELAALRNYPYGAVHGKYSNNDLTPPLHGCCTA